ncbi:MAG: LacI family DNA-binding transcriptional regulator [Armatimonadota bacterium]
MTTASDNSGLVTTARSKAATIEDVARAAGVALSTASGAFSGKKRMSSQTRENILGVAHALNYQPNPHAQRLSRQRSHNLVGLFTPYLDLSNATRKVKIIQRLLTEQGYEAPIYAAGDNSGLVPVDQRAQLRAFCRQRSEALVCFMGDMEQETHDELRRYQDDGGILVCFDHAIPDISCDQVVFDREDNAHQAAVFLINQGHQHIGFYYQIAGNAAGSERRAGFERALREANVAVRDEWLFPATPDEAFHEAEGIRIAQEFLQLTERPTAICGFPDLVAAVFVAQLRRSGLRIPEDVSVMANDDTPMTRYGAIPLTTTTHPIEEIARAAADLAASRLSGAFVGAPRRVTVRGMLIERESTSAPTPATEKKLQ